jgi:hypothetical protein
MAPQENDESTSSTVISCDSASAAPNLVGCTSFSILRSVRLSTQRHMRKAIASPAREVNSAPCALFAFVLLVDGV